MKVRTALRYAFTGESGKALTLGRFAGMLGTTATMPEDPLSMICVGSSGSGKSYLACSIFAQELTTGAGLIDPHGDLYAMAKPIAIAAIANAPTTNWRRIVDLNPLDPYRTHCINFLEPMPGQEPYELVMRLVETFLRLWADGGIQARAENILRSVFLLLAEAGLTLCEAPLVLTNDAVRHYLVAHLQNPAVRAYFDAHFNAIPTRTRMEWIESSYNKINAMLGDPVIRDIFGASKSTINFRSLMDNGSIFLCNLAKGRLRENGNLLGGILTTLIQQAAESRENIPEATRRPWALTLDEFQIFCNTSSYEEILTQCRKYGLKLRMYCQMLNGQLEQSLQDAVLANCSNQIFFRLNRVDAELVAANAFQVTGGQVKSQLFHSGSLFHTDAKTNPVYRSVQEEREHHINQLVSLPPRHALLHRVSKGARYFRTHTLTPTTLSQQAMQEAEQRINNPVTRLRTDVRQEIETRHRELLTRAYRWAEEQEAF